ncbi:hypothetical protein BC826DRAFT_998759 [Russula brevipes]|nr:hypothetical protein BC826DRAFT_998759 [Russula brevipes]
MVILLILSVVTMEHEARAKVSPIRCCHPGSSSSAQGQPGTIWSADESSSEHRMHTKPPVVKSVSVRVEGMGCGGRHRELVTGE